MAVCVAGVGVSEVVQLSDDLGSARWCGLEPRVESLHTVVAVVVGLESVEVVGSPEWADHLFESVLQQKVVEVVALSD